MPNGLAFARNGDFLIANFGTDCLEVMSRDGNSRVLADTIDGQPIGKVNFVLRDSKDRLWVTISTKINNWMHALRTDLKDGYVACYRDGAFRIVADGFGFTNEVRFDAKEEWLYVVETTGGCVTRLRMDEKGNLGHREVFGPDNLGKGAWPDGIAFDSFGNLWGTMVYSDKLFVLTPEGDLRILLDEGDPAKVDALERQFFDNRVTEEVLFATGERRGAVDGQRHIWRPRFGHRLYRIAQGQAHSVLPRAGCRLTDGALERCVWEQSMTMNNCVAILSGSGKHPDAVTGSLFVYALR